MTKICTRCGVEKPLDAMRKCNQIKCGYASICKKCSNSRHVDYVKKNMSRYLAMPSRSRSKRRVYEKTFRDKHLLCSHKRKLKHLYGMAESVYNEMYNKQDGVCAVCFAPEKISTGRRGVPVLLAVHHDHASGKVICLLCRKCNSGCGLFKDDPILLRRMAEIQEGIHEG